MLGQQINDEFSRNIGVLTVDEQRHLSATRVAVAGVGGVGGLHILTLARLGIGAFTIADPDIFELVNINRQFGANQSTFGRNKAEVLAEMVLEINPGANVQFFPVGVTSDNLDDFLQGVDIFVDGVDFFEIDIRRLIFNNCKRKGIFALTAAPLGFGATLQVFDPNGMGFDEFFGIDDDTPINEKIAAFAAGLAPTPLHVQYMDFSRVSIDKKTGPAVAPACTLAAALVATGVVKIVTQKGELKTVPHYLQYDMLLNKYIEGCMEFGGNSPEQLAMRKAILGKFTQRPS